MIRRLLAAAAIAVLSTVAHANNVDLSTVPTRESVQLTIYNSEDLTLVRERRKVSFKKGVNPLQFSWTNTLIDPTSVDLKFVTHGDKLTLSDTVFPHAKPTMLYWHVSSELDGDAMVEISYFTSGISWSADYVAIANQDETHMSVECFVRVTNRSGEDYEDASVRMVVGKVNLVQRIAELANVRVDKLGTVSKRDMGRLKRKASKDFMRNAELKYAEADREVAPAAPAEPLVAKPKAVTKEGLSEYFIYTIEGTESVPNGWSKRLRSFTAAQVPIRIQYRYRPREYGNRLVRMYLLTNDEKSKLGTTPLPDGMVRIFRQTGDDTLGYLAAVHTKYVPIGDKFELNLGVDPEVLFELIKQRTWRDNIWMRLRGGKVFQRVDDGNIRVKQNSSVAGWDEHTLYLQRIRNFTSKAIDVEIRRSYNGDILFTSAFPTKNHDFRTVEFSTEVPAMSKVDLPFEITKRQGRNAKQDRVELKRAKPGP